MAITGPGFSCPTGCTGWTSPSPSPAGDPFTFSFSAIILAVLARSGNAYVVFDRKVQSDSELSVS